MFLRWVFFCVSCFNSHKTCPSENLPICTLGSDQLLVVAPFVSLGHVIIWFWFFDIPCKCDVCAAAAASADSIIHIQLPLSSFPQLCRSGLQTQILQTLFYNEVSPISGASCYLEL